VIPYNDQLEKIRSALPAYANVTLFEQTDSIQFWQEFATAAWTSHPTAARVWREQGRPAMRRVEFHRKLCCFDGPFDQFVYMDADTLLLSPLDPVFDKLAHYDWVANDFQYLSDARLIFNLDALDLLQKYPLEDLKSHIFCSGFFAANQKILDHPKATDFLTRLTAGESDFMSLRGSDQPLFNYIVLGNGFSFYNLCYHDDEYATGSHWSSPFKVQDQVLYDQDKPLMYLHYMSISSSDFTRLCQGEDINVPYRDLFLHYRYLKTPQERPQVLQKPPRLVRVKVAIAQFKRQKLHNLNHRLQKLKYQLSQLRG
jgi:hypothetical protein